MARTIHLDKTLKQGTVVTTDERTAYIILAVGTNATSAGRLKIDNKPTGDIISDVAPLHVTSTNLLGPLPLGNYFYVVPEETKIEWDGPSATKARIIGTKIIFEPGEGLGEPYITRFKTQYDQYITYVRGTFSKGTDTAWPADEENEVISLTPKTIEKYVFDSVLMAEMLNVSGGVAEGDWAFRFYIDNNPLENLVGTNEQVGVDVLSAPEPPADTTEQIPFSLEAYPIELLGDRTLSIRVRNTSGASKSPTAGTSIQARITALTKFIRTTP